MVKKVALIQMSFVWACCIGLVNLFAPPSLAQGTSSLTVVPPRFELYTNPGETISDRIRVRNNADEPVTYRVRVEDFTTSGEEGQVVLEEEAPDSSFSLADWIELSSQDLILQPNEEKSVSFLINTPRNAEPGGHYGSILFLTGEEAEIEGGGASVAQRIGSLVLLRVSGNVTEQADLETFTTSQKFYDKAPVTLTLRARNQGNVHVRPEGTIVITDMFGKKVDELPLDGRNILPSATRKMDTVWDKPNLLGTYKATLIATYGQQDLPMTSAVTFTVISKMVQILGSVGAFALVGLVMTMIVGRRRFAKLLKVMVQG